jgi:hypothetical protein
MPIGLRVGLSPPGTTVTFNIKLDCETFNTTEPRLFYLSTGANTDLENVEGVFALAFPGLRLHFRVSGSDA